MPFGLAVEPGGVEDVERVLGVEGLRGTFVGRCLDRVVVPDVPALRHRAVRAGVLHDDDRLERRQVGHLLVDVRLDRRGLAAAAGRVGGDERLRLGELHALPHGPGREASEDDVVRSSDARAGQHRDDDLGDHRQVDADDVAGADAAVLQRVGQPLDVAVEIRVGDVPLLALLASPVDRDAVAAPGLDVAVEAVVRGVQLAVGEPLVEGRVGVVESLGRLGVPVEKLGRLPQPERLPGPARPPRGRSRP